MGTRFTIKITICLLVLTIRVLAQDSSRTVTPVPDANCRIEIARALPIASQRDRSELDRIVLSILRRPVERDRNASCVGIFLNAVGPLIQAREGTPAAESFVRHSIALLTNVYGPNDTILLRPFQILISWCLELGEVSKAHRAFRDMGRIVPRGQDDSVIVLLTRALIASSQGDRDEAEQDYLATLQLLADRNVSEAGVRAGVLNNLATLYLAEGNLSMARTALLRAETLARAEPNRDERERLMVGVLCNLGTVLYITHDYDSAAQEFHEAIAICDSLLYRDKERTVILLRNLAQVLKKRKRKDEAHLVNDRLNALLKDREVSGRSQTIDIGVLTLQQRSSSLQ